MCSWQGRINIIKISLLLKILYRFNTITIKIPKMYFIELEEIFKMYMEPQKTPDSHSNLEKEE